MIEDIQKIVNRLSHDYDIPVRLTSYNYDSLDGSTECNFDIKEFLIVGSFLVYDESREDHLRQLEDDLSELLIKLNREKNSKWN